MSTKLRNQKGKHVKGSEKRVKAKSRKGMSVDRISNLPDEVLLRILSFLPTKHVVATSVLSTRWKFLFASVPNLDFDDSLLLNPQLGEHNFATIFMNFVDKVLFLRNVSSIDKFHLKCGKDIDSLCINGWIDYALLHGVKELDLCIFTREFSVVPADFFTCKTLVVLKLCTGSVLDVPAEVCLPNLRFLHLESIEFLDDNSTQRLFSSCPVLEDLFIIECELKNINKLNISAPTLKRFTLDCSAGLSPSNEFCNYEIVIDAPNLVDFTYLDNVAKAYSLINLHSLVEAHIVLGFTGDRDYDYSLFCAAAIDLLRSISNVHSLYISGDVMEVLRYIVDPLPVFHNMTRLTLGVVNCGTRKPLPDLLECSPHLENLVLEELWNLEYYVNDNLYKPRWLPTEKVASCLLFHLKEIEILSFEGKKDEMSMVKYFLKNAKVLKKLTIYYSGNVDEKEQLKITKKLLMLPRGSKRCRVVIG